MCKPLVLLFSAFVIFGLSEALANDIAFTPEFLLIEDKEDYPLGKHLFFLEDPVNSHVETIFQHFSQEEFQPLGHPNLFNKGFSQSIWWFALPLENALNRENSVIFSPASASILEGTLYIFSEEGILLDSLLSGYGIHNNQRDMDTRLISYHITLKPKEKVILLLKADSRGRNT